MKKISNKELMEMKKGCVDGVGTYCNSYNLIRLIDEIFRLRSEIDENTEKENQCVKE